MIARYTAHVLHYSPLPRITALYRAVLDRTIPRMHRVPRHSTAQPRMYTAYRGPPITVYLVPRTPPLPHYRAPCCRLPRDPYRYATASQRGEAPQSFDGKIARNKSGFVNTIYKMSNAGGRLQTATSKSACGSPSGNIVSA